MALEQFWLDARSKIQHHQCVSISTIMTSDVITLQRTDTIRDAIELFKIYRIRHVVVIDEEQKVRGVFTKRDLINLSKVPLDRMIMSVATPDVFTGGIHQCTRQVATMMLENKIGCVPIVSNAQGANSLAGIVTEADFVKAFALGTSCSCGAMSDA